MSCSATNGRAELCSWTGNPYITCPPDQECFTPTGMVYSEEQPPRVFCAKPTTCNNDTDCLPTTSCCQYIGSPQWLTNCSPSIMTPSCVGGLCMQQLG
jgi:hypothetical protein